MTAPTGASLRRPSRVLPVALLASVAGLAVCGATFALAGDTVHVKPIELIDPLPDGVVVVADDVNCATLPGTDQEQCRRRVVVRRDGTASDHLVEELTTMYRDRGFVLNAVIAGNGRTYFGSFAGDTCEPQLFVGGEQVTAVLPDLGPNEGVPGRRDRVPPMSTTTTVDPATGEVTTNYSTGWSSGDQAIAAQPATGDGDPDDGDTGDPIVGPTGPVEGVEVPGALTGAVTIELSEPYPGMC